MTKTRCRWCILVMLLVVVMFVSGCETLKGAAQGLHEDWNTLTKWQQNIAW